tara:strand:+ start:509 stop:733 length:225 start_codon:yes stop_codon:yes gene_type:complete
MTWGKKKNDDNLPVAEPVLPEATVEAGNTPEVQEMVRGGRRRRRRTKRRRKSRRRRRRKSRRRRRRKSRRRRRR